ncbi:NADH-quinone oxidoreductase subunit E [Thermosipho melanesiensis]|uniref:NADH dehydrogenase (Ubiquinone), 24 kDa subunit n=2 Tax=Thermosipho melanesiensis TaxID=46541 RepID=A6LM72_THEM4|nr:NAD(P)H-dependent oxidoreductase subunit E [Thermosipho melanesiensis]ABR31023.1 NADH dehydrogenase (ubiquinone), 24 kDa subunit [Thermosipho melanesiensis BI429]APT74117.1 NADH-quinone oxidoreductase subunit E [Thermosipho melanesiensis]OOC36065.1 NADH-quinone oxidoreductase subunit E [Thermosipho melanesiensis]OOC36882.1 NADH-quinone oxidoreductase subunit E [Thermosipho melanesiensis]OOC37633.1 NADH-quinone oxidoreductase subunit E [Thermosipho melanesiensis]
MLSKIKDIISEAKNERLEEKDILIYTLHKIQDISENNFISEEAAKIVSEELNIPLSKVYEVLTFYSMFSTKKRGKYLIRVCSSLPCHVANGREIIKILKEELKIDFNQTTADGMFTLEETGCLGLCGVSPVIMINNKYYGDLTPEKVKELINKIKRGEEI